MEKTKCLNCNGGISYNDKVIGKPLFCNLDCKRDFLLKNYSDSQARVWFKERDNKFREGQKKMLIEIRKSGLTIREYLLSLGDFKEDDEPQ